MLTHKIFAAVALIVIIGVFMTVSGTEQKEMKAGIVEGINEIDETEAESKDSLDGGENPDSGNQEDDLMALPTIKRSELPAEDDPDRYRFVHGAWISKDGSINGVTVNGDEIEEAVSVIYSEEVKKLQPKTADEIELLKDDDWFWLMQEDMQEYGEVVLNYLPIRTIVDYYQVDVDNDGKKEDLVTSCNIGANHCSDLSEIIKDGNVIFSVDLGENGIGFTPSEGGFYIEWIGEDSYVDEKGNDIGYCCPTHHHKTLFLYQNGKFEPVQQWKIEQIDKRVID